MYDSPKNCNALYDNHGYSEPVPDLQSKVRTREIGITELDHGYIVRVGCHAFAITSKVELIEKLTQYINDPAETENQWFSGTLFQ